MAAWRSWGIPDLVFLVVMHAEPLIERDGVLECLDLSGIDFDGRHHDTLSHLATARGIAPVQNRNRRRRCRQRRSPAEVKDETDWTVSQ